MARILVVDDEPRIRSFLSRALSADGHAVEVAEDGRRALRLIALREYDLVLLDLVLPGIDGVSVLRQAQEIREDLSVLVMSALSDVRAKVECLEMGAGDYVTKPFAVAEMMARVHARLREPGSASARRLRVGHLTIDLARRIVLADGDRVALTAREFLLLEHLARNFGRTCARDELLSAVWEPGGDAASNVVEACVRRLRAKMGPQHIETVRNVGYRLVAA